MTLYLFNTTIAVIPDSDSEAQFSYKRISLKEAKLIFDSSNFQSAIGHESTAQIMNELLVDEVYYDHSFQQNRKIQKIQVNRINAQLKVGDKALCFKLKGRPPEGAILSAEEVEKIGYEFVLLERTA